MTTPSDLNSLSSEEMRVYGFARVRDIAFDAVSALWRRRQLEGMTQADLATAIAADTGWISKNLRGPGNWTLRTFGALVAALGGEVQITVRASEDPLPIRSNYHAYVDYPLATSSAGQTTLAQGVGAAPQTNSQPIRPASTVYLTTVAS